MEYKILVIDDDCDFVDATKMLLEADGYNVITANNGQEGFQKVKKELPDLILLDMMMTYKTEGAETAKAITADAAVKDVPIIMITGAKKEFSFPFELKADDENLPIKAILEKPVDPENLLKNVRMFLGKRGAEHYKNLSMTEQLIKKWEGREGNLIMILHEVQNHYGFIPRNVAFDLASYLDTPLARIYEVISFYHYFKLQAPGKHIISVCIGTACYLKGAPQLLKEIKHLLNIEEGQITDDGMFQLEGVRCLGCCGLAPVIMIDDKIYGNLKPNDLIDIISKYTNNKAEAA